MPNTKAAKKALRVAQRRTIINRARKSRVRTFIRKVEKAIEAGDLSAAKELFPVTQGEIMKGAQRGVMHKRTAARKISRLHHKIRQLEQGAQA